MAIMSNPNANTYVPQGTGGDNLEYEELRDVIEELTPEETPLYSNSMKGTVRSINPDWSTIELGTITAAQAEKRGFVASLRAPIVPDRLGNIVELVAETGSVADSFDAIDLAGREDETDWQMLLKARRLRLMVNKLLYSNQAQSNVEPTKMACFPTWIGGGRFVSIATTPGTASSGDGTDVYVAGTGPQPLDSIDPIDDVMQAAYDTNGQPKIMIFNPAVKRQYSRIPDASVAENRINMTASRQPQPFMFIGSVDVYLSDYGLLETVMDRQADPSYIAFVDPEMWEIATLPGRAFKRTPLAKIGSSSDFMIEWEGTVRVWNPTAHAMIEGIDPTP